MVNDDHESAHSRLIGETPRLTQIIPKVIPGNVQAECEVGIVG